MTGPREARGIDVLRWNELTLHLLVPFSERGCWKVYYILRNTTSSAVYGKQHAYEWTLVMSTVERHATPNGNSDFMKNKEK
jgi:hypothetical protein